MKVKLLRDARVRHSAGEIVEVSPAECHFLVSTNSAMVIKNEAEEKAVAPKKRKSTK